MTRPVTHAQLRALRLLYDAQKAGIRPHAQTLHAGTRNALLGAGLIRHAWPGQTCSPIELTDEGHRIVLHALMRTP